MDDTRLRTVDRWPCPACGDRPIEVEIEGRVLVCRSCSEDEVLREHARETYR